MQYISNKTVTRYQNGKSSEIIRKGKRYNSSVVSTFPSWYLTDNYLTKVD